MEQAFSRITAILTAAVMLFIVPVVINLQRQENLIQSSIMQFTVQFVDSVRNVGMITEEMLNRYRNQISTLQGGLKIHMVHTVESLYVENGSVEHTSVTRTETDISDSLETNGKYLLQQGDYFRVEVRKPVSGYLRIIYDGYQKTAGMEDTVYAYYGGSVRYENE